MAAEKGWGDRVNYFVADLNKACFPPSTYDAAFASQSLHHIKDLEHLFAQVHQTLKPGGLFVVNEFVGPNQFQWTDKQLQHARAAYRKIPLHYRVNLRNGQIKPEIARQTIAKMNAVDPTEAIRSQDILPLIYQQFDVIDRADFGGTIVNLVLDGIAGNFTSSPEDRALLQELCATEQALLRSGELTSDFMVLVARRRG
jgi:SAM-dependent methyltransferase